MIRTMAAFAAAVLAFGLALAPTGAALAQVAKPSLSVAILPMPGDDAIADEAARQVWPLVASVAAALARGTPVIVISNDAVVKAVGDDPSAVDAAQELNVRYVLMGDVSNDNGLYRFHCQLRDGRNGAIVWAQVMITDDFNITTFPHEMALTLVRVMREVAGV
jgi:TolB-like protein